MSTKKEIREFLVARRAEVTPEAAGLAVITGQERRVPGLRREEVAVLAGVSTDYYARLERGDLRHASDSVLNAIARALRLDDVQRTHLFDLARTAPKSRPPRLAPDDSGIRASVQQVLDSMTVPAVVYNAEQDLVASNMAGRALFAPHFDTERPNFARFIFLDSRARSFYGDWELACSLTAAMLRYEAGRNPLNTALTALIGELSTRSPQFRKDWADHDVHEHRTGRKIYRSPIVGDLDLAFDVFEMPGQPGLSIGTYAADPGSQSAGKLALLSSWAASHDDLSDASIPVSPLSGLSRTTAQARPTDQDDPR
jgi:transcriptional regulator with XRE-family HTH domain